MYESAKRQNLQQSTDWTFNCKKKKNICSSIVYFYTERKTVKASCYKTGLLARFKVIGIACAGNLCGNQTYSLNYGMYFGKKKNGLQLGRYEPHSLVIQWNTTFCVEMPMSFSFSIYFLLVQHEISYSVYHQVWHQACSLGTSTWLDKLADFHVLY